MTNLNILTPNKSIIYNCAIEGMDTIVRTGTIDADPLSSFLNCVLHSCSLKFASETLDERRASITEFLKLVIKKYKTYPTSAMALTNILSSFYHYLSSFYKFLYNNTTDDITVDEQHLFSELIDTTNEETALKDIEIYKIIFDIIPLSGGFDKNLNNSKQRWFESESKTLLDLTKIIIKDTIRYFRYKDVYDNIDIEISDYIKIKIMTLLNSISKRIQKDDIENLIPHKVDLDIIQIASRYFKCRIFFVDFDTKLPIEFDGYNYNNELKAILLLSFQHEHYEVIGKLVKDGLIQREFLPHEEIVKTTLYHLDIVKKKIDDEEESL